MARTLVTSLFLAWSGTGCSPTSNDSLSSSGPDEEVRVALDSVVRRGALPPIVEGVPARPEGLLVGLPGGLSLEYRADDVRWLGVRRGAFAEVGDALRPLGELLVLSDGGDPGPGFSLVPEGGAATSDDLVPLRAELRDVRADGAIAYLDYALRDPLGELVATVTESLQAVENELGPSFVRLITLETPSLPITLVAHALFRSVPDEGRAIGWFCSGPPLAPEWSVSCGQVSEYVARARGGWYQVLVEPRPDTLGSFEPTNEFTLKLAPGEPTRFEQELTFLSHWDEETETGRCVLDLLRSRG